MKPYLLFRTKQSPYWYAQIRLPDGSLTNNKSTGKEKRSEAERVVMEWIVKGATPERISRSGKEVGNSPLEMISVFNLLKTKDFSNSDVDEILEILKKRNYITSAVRPKTVASRDVMEYLFEFWDFEKSPYLRELSLKGKPVHKRHAFNMTNTITNHWKAIVDGKSVGEITKDDINKIFTAESTQKLSPKTVCSVLKAMTIPMKWAHLHGLTEINCYDGIIKPSGKPKEKVILTMEETRALFNAEWENDTAKLACLIAAYTGMRQGEIRALRCQDIGDDRIYIRHSWGEYDGLKSPKNGDEREIRIPQQLRNMIIYQASFNPWNQGMSGFIFFNKEFPDSPMDPKVWTKYLRRALESIGYANPKEICFHSFRHEWCTTQLSEIGDQRVCMIGSGHKSDEIFTHYANHIKKEQALQRIAETSEKLFADILDNIDCDDVEFMVIDDEKETENETEDVKLLPAVV